MGNQMNYSAKTDPELAIGFAGRPKTAKCRASSGAIAEAAFIADLQNYALLRPVLLELRRQTLRAS
jgi:hypothetical protein